MFETQTEDPGCSNPVECVPDFIDGLEDAINGAAEAVGFWTDPWGNTFKTMQEAAHGLAHDVLPFITEATLPDLNADWFLKAYAVSFALSFFVAVVLLLSLFYKVSRGLLSGEELSETLTIFTPAFIAGSMFGPMAGWVIIRFFHSLSDVVAAWAIEGSVNGIVTELQEMIDEVDPAGVAGGVVIAVLLMICMVIALFLVMLVLLVQLVTLYFVGTIIPIALVWMLDPGRRPIAWRVFGIWIGLLAAHPLLFFLLGVAFSMTAASVGTFGNPSLTAVVQLIVAVVSLFMAALSPLVLMKFAPVLAAPSGSSAANVPSPSGHWGSNGPRDAVDRYGDDAMSGPPRSQKQAQTVSSDSGPNLLPGGTSLADAAEGVGGGARAAGAGAGAGAAGAAGAEAAGAGAAGGAAGAAEGLAVAGVAESGTGVGAAIGVPTLLAAGAVAAGEAATKATEKAGDYSLAAMDEAENQQ